MFLKYLFLKNYPFFIDSFFYTNLNEWIKKGYKKVYKKIQVH